MGYFYIAKQLGIDIRITGIDIAPQPNYPFTFWQADALDYLGESIDKFYPYNHYDFIHASPPCQAHTNLKSMPNAREHEDLIEGTRSLLNVIRDEIPWVIENVVGAPLIDPAMLCGSMFDPPLDVRRHRLFEANFEIAPPKPCDHSVWTPRFPMTGSRREGKLASVVHVFGEGNHHFSGPGCYERETELRRQAMEMPWATRAELNEAIPPRYTYEIGKQLFTDMLSKHCQNKEEFLVS